jgi:polyphenol oxidase
VGSTASDQLPIERFPALDVIPSIQHAFIARVAGINVASDKAEALRRLDGVHREARRLLRLGDLPFITAEQVHGCEVAVIAQPVAGDQRRDGCDGLITNQRGVVLGIYVADCGAVFLVDPIRQAIGLVHSGKKGTELGIVGNAIELMREHFGSAPEDLIVQLSPCIRPPHYEIDFAADVVRQCRERGVQQVHDSGVCTACDLERYYSYRAEKSRTGRMLALLALT